MKDKEFIKALLRRLVDEEYISFTCDKYLDLEEHKVVISVNYDGAAQLLLDAGIGDIRNESVEAEVAKRDAENLMRTLEEGSYNYSVVCRALELLCKQANEDTEGYGYCSCYTIDDFIERAQEELYEEAKNERCKHD